MSKQTKCQVKWILCVVSYKAKMAKEEIIYHNVTLFKEKTKTKNSVNASILLYFSMIENM